MIKEENKIGYWRDLSGQFYPNLPKVEEFIDPSWNSVEKKMVIDYIKDKPVIHSYRGWSQCRCCNKPNGSQCMSDGVYQWPQGYLHYIESHNVKPPQKFIDHVMKNV